MDATAHLHIWLDFNINISRDFKCINFQLVLSLHTFSAVKFIMLNNSEPMILIINI
jgi:hypothetical protein